MSWLAIVFNWLFPLLCVGCDRPGGPVCSDCFRNLSPKSPQECPYCREANLDGSACPTCRQAQDNSLDGLICLFDYQKGGIIAKLLHNYKYELLEEYGASLLEIFKAKADTWKSSLKSDQIIVTWPPMTKKKKQKRGFNQSEQLARTLQWGETVPLLDKIRETPAQMTLKRGDRLKNLLNSFSIGPNCIEKIIGRKVLIVDDIATTLATINELAKILKMAGAKHVFGITVARQKL